MHMGGAFLLHTVPNHDTVTALFALSLQPLPILLTILCSSSTSDFALPEHLT